MPKRRTTPTLSRLTLLSAAALLLLLAAGCNTTTDPESGSASAQAEAAAGERPRASAEMAANGPIAEPSDVELSLLKHALVNVQIKYYDPSRVDYRKMMAHAFDALQSNLVEVVADFDQPLEQGPTKVTLRVNTHSKDFDLSKVDDISSVHSTSVEAVQFLVSTMTEDKPLNELEYTVINGMLDTLDPHSVLLTPKVYDDMQTSHGGFGGLGIVIGIRDEELTVISPIEGTPASKAGLKAQDKITRIGEESTINMPLHEAVDRLRGEVGTDIDIEVMRKNWTEPKEFTITRAKIEIRSLITHAIEDEKIAYIKIKAFEENTGEDVRNKLAEMRKDMGEVKGLILDLRFNAGGLLSQAIAVADTFLPGGKEIVIQEGVGGKNRESADATDVFTEPDYPIVVIVNPGSASASEIVAGALKAHDRAVLIGEQTFGKGSVQSLAPNDDGSALKLTIAQYLTPGDVSIQGVGIAPDVRVAPVYITEEEGERNVDLFVSENIRREGSLELALQSEKTREADEPVAVVRYLYDEAAEEARTGETFEEDFEIRLARSMLTSTKTSARPKFLEQVQTAMSTVADAETANIAAELEKQGVDWTRSDGELASQPFTTTIELNGQTVTGGTVPQVKAGDTLKLTATVQNTGDKAIERLFAITHSNNPLIDDRELIFGRIEPGASQSWDLEIKVPRGTETRQDALTLSFGDRNGKLDTETVLDVAMEGLPQPRYAFTYQVDDTAGGNGDGLLQVGEEVDFIVDIANMGVGDSTETLAFLKSNAGASMFLDKGRETVGAIDSGEWGTAQMRFKVQSMPEDKNLEFELTVYDKEFGSRLMETVELPVYEKDTTKWQAAQGTATFKKAADIYAGARSDTVILGKGTSGKKLRYAGTDAEGKLHRVEWTQGDRTRFGWVASPAIDIDAKGTGADSDAVQYVARRMAPTITIDNPTLVAKTDRIELKGTIADDDKVEDYRVYLWHRDGQTTHAQKLDYGVGGRADKKFAVDVPLRSGVNRVTIVARDVDKLENSQTVYIWHP